MPQIPNLRLRSLYQDWISVEVQTLASGPGTRPRWQNFSRSRECSAVKFCKRGGTYASITIQDAVSRHEGWTNELLQVLCHAPRWTGIWKSRGML